MPSILVVSDLTHAADEAIRGAASLGRRTGSALHVVHFPAQVTLPAREAEVRRDGALLRAAADALDHQLRRSLPPGAVTGAAGSTWACRTARSWTRRGPWTRGSWS
jgi:nucleotide-binding universal stress UspA family protein